MVSFVIGQAIWTDSGYEIRGKINVSDHRVVERIVRSGDTVWVSIAGENEATQVWLSVRRLALDMHSGEYQVYVNEASAATIFQSADAAINSLYTFHVTVPEPGEASTDITLRGYISHGADNKVPVDDVNILWNGLVPYATISDLRRPR